MPQARPTAPSVEVVVIPVSVRQDGPDGRPTLMGWPGLDGWARKALGRTAAGTAGYVLKKCLPPGAEMLLPQRQPQPVTFAESRGRSGTRLTLLYTVALPMALCDPAVTGSERWLPLLRPEERATDARRVGAAMLVERPFAFEIIDHWRQALEQTGAGLQFLSRHWTLSQLRDVYSGVWGYEQDTASFTKWALKRPGAFSELVQPLEDKDLTPEIAEALATASDAGEGPRGRASSSARAAEAATNAIAWTALARGLRPAKSVGLSAGAAALVGGALPVVPIAAAAAAVAYQASTRGAPANWYTTATDAPDQHRLEHVYTPRPAWLSAGSDRSSQPKA